MHCGSTGQDKAGSSHWLDDTQADTRFASSLTPCLSLSALPPLHIETLVSICVFTWNPVIDEKPLAVF
ncbi:hypothetical protein CgunFtcFv8_027408 [Champsocephalus gunnari]|uniref:Uncharacterized protein n=1 Tax=Champsocephalus gunnari TaxID=52237 RepID=A0AAN8E454_CHAGU|nr:hypothetical protein CgunFtcFv8_027408 [Champsocephalus gunnari]